MGIFTFTINCGASPTPTPTPTPTPCPCRDFFVENQGGVSETVYYTDCRGILRSFSLSGGNATTICACSVEPGLNIVATDVGSCSAPTDTPTPTPTSTPTPTLTATPTPTPTNPALYTITVYASFGGNISGSPTLAGPGGPGVETAARAYYWRGVPTTLGNTLLGGNITSKSCNSLGTVSSVSAGTRFHIGMRSYSYEVPIYFSVSTVTCVEAQAGIYCGTVLDPGGGYSFVVTGNTTLYLNAIVDIAKAGLSLAYCQYNYVPY